MLYRFRADIAYPGTEEGWDALNDLVEEVRRRIGGATVVNEGRNNEERGYFEVEECLHEDFPPGPCRIIEKWEVGRGQVI